MKLDEIFAKCERNGDCLLWRGRFSDDGYPIFKTGGRKIKTRRVVYELSRGVKLQSTQAVRGVPGKCDERICCEPSHLYVEGDADSLWLPPSGSTVNVDIAEGPLGAFPPQQSPLVIKTAEEFRELLGSDPPQWAFSPKNEPVVATMRLDVEPGVTYNVTVDGPNSRVAATVDSYQSFVATKLALHVPTGIESADDYASQPVFEHLFPFQRALVLWALRLGRAAICADTGLGKSRCQLAWAHCVALFTRKPVIIFAPLAVATQTVDEGKAIGIEVNLCREAGDVCLGPFINIINYERKHLIDCSVFGAVVWDECFAPDSLVERVVAGRVELVPISSIRIGDAALNASGVDAVYDVHRREVPFGVEVEVDGRRIICSPNHPFFTQRGWVGAQDLSPGDAVLRTRSAVRLVRESVSPEMARSSQATLLREILLSEMAHESSGSQGQGSHGSGAPETHGFHPASSLEPNAENEGQQRTHPRVESYVESGTSRDVLPPVESHEPSTFRAWGQRAWFDEASADSSGCTWRELGGGICFVTGPKDSGLSDALQTRLGTSRASRSHRGGWQLPPQPETSGRQERREAAFARVASLAILEPGDSRLERYRSDDGKLYFYDLGATRHPSFSVNGLLVHNSSIFKDYSSKTLSEHCASFGNTPFRLACTATPSPNDYIELGSHAELLGICSRQEMLAEYFVHDGGSTQDWRLKGHARQSFWKFISSFMAMVRKPSDLGFSDDGYDLPPLDVRQHVVASTVDLAAMGLLVAPVATTLSEQRVARKESLLSRVDECAALVNSECDEPWVVWAELNVESEALAVLIDGAIEVTGSQTIDEKERRLMAFLRGEYRVLVTKPSIAGHGLNMQRCAHTAFVDVSHSYEQYYQAVRRFHRFGQKRRVRVHLLSSEAEGPVLRNLQRKERAAQEMADELSRETRDMVRAAVTGQRRRANTYAPSVQMQLPEWLKRKNWGHV